MRITSSMAVQLLDIQNNMKTINALNQQISIGKSVQFPSDDPIRATRILKFREIVDQTEQYKRNVDRGRAWMDISELAMRNVESLESRIRELCVQASSDLNTIEDRRAIAVEIRTLFEQVGQEMNQTYEGRYVFSGFRTDQPPVLIEDSAKTYVIAQLFDAKDIEKTKSYQKPEFNEPALVNDINILKLAYKNVAFEYIAFNEKGEDVSVLTNLGIAKPDGTAYTIVNKSSKDADAYTPPDDGGTIYYIADKGELVLGDKAVEDFEDGTKATYKKSDLKAGELNPVVYFECSEIMNAGPGEVNTSNPGIVYRCDYLLESKEVNNALMQCTTGVENNQYFYFFVDNSAAVLASFDLGAHMQKYYAENATAKDWSYPDFNSFMAQMYNNPPDPSNPYAVSAENEAIFLDVLQGGLNGGFANNTLTPPLTDATPIVTKNSEGKVEIDFSFTYAQGSEVGFAAVGCDEADDRTFGHGFLHNMFDHELKFPIIIETGDVYEGIKGYDMEDQYIQLECSIGSLVRINTLSKYAYTDKMYTDLLRLHEFALSVSPSDYDALRDKYSGEEYNLSGDKLNDAISTQLQTEAMEIRNVLQCHFSNMLGLGDRHANQVMNEHGDLGRRLVFMQFFETRLMDNKINYRKLLSETEDTDMVQNILRMNESQTTYSSALKVTSKIGQLALSNYIS